VDAQAPYDGRHAGLVAEAQEPQGCTEAAMRRFAEEYNAKLEAGDPDALEVSRNYYDNDGGSTRFEAGLAAYLIVLTVSVSLLVGLFMLIEKLIGR
jgi:hypothetical protein